jgi:hypothetical protein
MIHKDPLAAACAGAGAAEERILVPFTLVVALVGLRVVAVVRRVVAVGAPELFFDDSHLMFPTNQNETIEELS